MMAATLVAVMTVGFAPCVADADEKAALEGTVRSAGGDPVAGAEVSLPELRRTTITNDEGHFTFLNCRRVSI